MNTKFSNEYPTPPLSKIDEEEKICLLLGDFNFDLLQSLKFPSLWIIFLHIYLLYAFFNQQD